jgi:hypothetical protein
MGVFRLRSAQQYIKRNRQADAESGDLHEPIENKTLIGIYRKDLTMQGLNR